MSSYRDHFHQVGGQGGTDVVCTHSWAEHTLARQEFLYPGRDHQAAQAADVARWNALGSKKAAA